MLTAKYARRPFTVRGVQVTEGNMAEVAEWCHGTIESTPDGTPFVKVDVRKPVNERQTQAFVTCWVLFAANGYKVYSDKAFKASFELVEEVVEIPVQKSAPEDETAEYAAAVAAQEKMLNRS